MDPPLVSTNYIPRAPRKSGGRQRQNTTTAQKGGAEPRNLTVQEVAAAPMHKDTEFAKRVLEDEVYWWLTHAILFENCLKSQGYVITPRSDFSRRNMAIGAWIAEHENNFVLTGTPAEPVAPEPIALEIGDMNDFYDLLEDE
jgi:hypothetical protein